MPWTLMVIRANRFVAGAIAAAVLFLIGLIVLYSYGCDDVVKAAIAIFGSLAGCVSCLLERRVPRKQASAN